MILIVPLIELGIWFAKSSGTAHVYDVPTPVAIVLDASPKEYSSACVKLLAALGVFIVTELPKSIDDDDNVGCVARGIVTPINVPLMLALPIPSDVVNAAATGIDMLPSDACVFVKLPLAIVVIAPFDSVGRL